jgi:hypothetical protein
MTSLVVLGAALWGAATLYIRFLPAAVADPVWGAVGFATTLPIAWLTVRLIERVGRLAHDQLLAGVVLVGAVAMMIDGVALRWGPGVYASSDGTVRLGAAWLLWGYGLSLAVATYMVRRGKTPA